MPFKISEASSYPWPVSGELAGHPWKMTAHFSFLPQDRIDELVIKTARRTALLERGEDDPKLQDVTALNTAAEVLVGWDDVTDDEGEPIEFSPQVAQKWLRIQGVASAVVAAWIESLQGAKRGNSKAPRGIG